MNVFVCVHSLYSDKVQGLCYASHTRQLISCSSDGGIVIWNMDVTRQEVIECNVNTQTQTQALIHNLWTAVRFHCGSDKLLIFTLPPALEWILWRKQTSPLPLCSASLHTLTDYLIASSFTQSHFQSATVSFCSVIWPRFSSQFYFLTHCFCCSWDPLLRALK